MCDSEKRSNEYRILVEIDNYVRKHDYFVRISSYSFVCIAWLLCDQLFRN